MTLPNADARACDTLFLNVPSSDRAMQTHTISLMNQPKARGLRTREPTTSTQNRHRPKRLGADSTLFSTTYNAVGCTCSSAVRINGNFIGKGLILLRVPDSLKPLDNRPGVCDRSHQRQKNSSLGPVSAMRNSICDVQCKQSLDTEDHVNRENHQPPTSRKLGIPGSP